MDNGRMKRVKKKDMIDAFQEAPHINTESDVVCGLRGGCRGDSIRHVIMSVTNY